MRKENQTELLFIYVVKYFSSLFEILFYFFNLYFSTPSKVSFSEFYLEKKTTTTPEHNRKLLDLDLLVYYL